MKRAKVILIIIFIILSMSDLIANEMIQYKNELLRCTPAGDIEYSRDNGISWLRRFSHTYNTGKFKDLLEFDNEILAITDNGLFYSRDKGVSWLRRFTPTFNTGNFISMTVSGNELLAQTDKGLFYSRDNGVSWLRRGN